MATREEIETIECEAYNECARAMAQDGVELSYKQADRIGEQGLAWIQRRLGLRVEETDTGVVCTPQYPGDSN